MLGTGTDANLSICHEGIYYLVNRKILNTNLEVLLNLNIHLDLSSWIAYAFRRLRGIIIYFHY